MIYSKTNLETTKKISFILLHGGFEERVKYSTKESGKKLEHRDEKMKKRERTKKQTDESEGRRNKGPNGRKKQMDEGNGPTAEQTIERTKDEPRTIDD